MAHVHFYTHVYAHVHAHPILMCMCMPMHMPMHMPAHVPVHLSMHTTMHLPTHMPVHMLTHVPIYTFYRLPSPGTLANHWSQTVPSSQGQCRVAWGYSAATYELSKQHLSPSDNGYVCAGARTVPRGWGYKPSDAFSQRSF